MGLFCSHPVMVSWEKAGAKPEILDMCIKEDRDIGHAIYFYVLLNSYGAFDLTALCICVLIYVVSIKTIVLSCSQEN